MFADRPSAKKGFRTAAAAENFICAKLINGHYSASPASVSKPSGITARSSVLRGRIAINYCKRENSRYSLKYSRHEHLLAVNICQAAGYQGGAANKIKRWFHVAAADDIAERNIIQILTALGCPLELRRQH
jgi:hypothetical protein